MYQTKIKSIQIENVNVDIIEGVIPISKGGTGAVTSDIAINNLIPSQIDNQGKFLTTNGTAVYWENITGGTVTSVDVSGGITGLIFTGGPIETSGVISLSGVLSISHGGTGQSSFTSGYIKSDGETLISSVTIRGQDVDGDITGKSSNVTGVVAIENGGTGADNQQAALNNLSGTLTENTVLRSDGINVTLGKVNVSSDVTGILSIENGGTGKSNQQDAINALSGTQIANRVLRSDGTNISLSQVNLTTDVIDILPVANGGTGKSVFEAGYLKSDGSVLISSTLIPASDIDGDIIGKSSNITGILSIENGGTGASTSLEAFNALLSNQTDNQGKVLSTDGTSILWIPAGGVGTVTSIDVSGGTTGLTTSGGPIEAAGVITLSGTLSIEHGGTSADNAATAINNLLPAQTGNSGKYLTTNGTSASWGVAGSSGQLLFNNAGQVNGTSQISYNGSNIITLGSSAGNFTLTGRGSQSAGYDGTSVTIVGGVSSNTGVVGGEPGHVYVRGGPGAYNGAGGNVYLQGGSGDWRSGTVYISTGQTLTERLRIIPNGAWGLGGANYGTDGQVLLSKGSGAPPVWGNPSVSVASGVLPIENGGTGSTTGLDAINALLTDQAENNGKVLSTNGTSVQWVPAGGVGTVTSVDIDPGTTGLIITGGPIDAAGTFTLGGALTIEHGGTGATTVTDAQINLFPTQTGNSGKYLTTDGTNISWGIAGSSGQLLFNNNGSVSGTSRISYDGNSTLSLGALAIGGSSFTIKPVNGSGVLTAPELIIQGGASSNDGQISQGPGNVYIKGGAGAGSSGLCGSVYIDGGAGTGTPGAILFRTGLTSTERFRIATTGAWGLGGANYGTDGQVLMSKGSGLTPVWTDVAGAYTLPTASDTTLGGVKIDNATILIDADGIISAVPGTYVLPVASTSTLGGVKVDGETVTIDANGIISSASAYTLPTASTTELGGVKVDGTTVAINNGVISAISTVSSSSLYDFGISIPGIIGVGTIYLTAITRSITFSAGLPLSVARTLVAPTYGTTIYIKVSSSAGVVTTVGNIFFDAGSYTGIFNVQSDFDLNTGDILYFYNSTYDPTFSDLAITLASTISL